MQSFGYTSGPEDGFDAMVEFPPHSLASGESTDEMPGVEPRFKGKIFSYPDVMRYCLRLGSGIGLPVYRGLMTGWDNTPRRGSRATSFDDATPEHYEVWLRRLLDYTRRHHAGRPPADFRQRLERMGRGRLPRAG